MNPRTRFLAVAAGAALAAAAGPASARGVSRWIGGLVTAASGTKAAVASNPGKLRHAKTLSAHLAAKTNSLSLSAELTSVTKAAAIFESKLPAEPLLANAFITAQQGYAQDFSATRRAIHLAATSKTIPKADRNRYAAAEKKFEAAFTAKRKPTTPLVDQFSRGALATRHAAGFTPYDGGRTYDWVISSLEIAGPGIGVDLSGDGEVDNQLGAIQSTLGITSLGDLINDAIESGGRYALLEMWCLKTLAKPDPVVFVGVMGATDGDADTANDFTGAGVFAVDGGAVAIDDGRPHVRTATAFLARGKYSVSITNQSIQLGSVVLPIQSKLVIKGTATTSSNFGLLGLGIPVNSVIAMAATAGVPLDPSQQLLLSQLADLDLDANVAGNDAISVSCNFTAVKATVTRP